MGKYDDYVEMCENEGETPDLYPEWHAKRMAAGRAEKAEAPPVEETKAQAKTDSAQAELEAKIAAMEAKLATLEPVEPEVIVERPREWGEDGIYTYRSIYKEHQLTRKSTRGVSPEGRLVTDKHIVVEFSDFLLKCNKDTSDWIENEAIDHSTGLPIFNREIFRTTTMESKPMKVIDGPKTSIPQQTHRYADRPTPLHANA